MGHLSFPNAMRALAQADSFSNENHQADWLVLCAAIVLLMQAGFMCLESGLVREKNSINTAVKNLTDLLVSVCFYWIAGFALMFGTTSLGLVGTGQWMPDFSSTESLAAFFLFQAMFCGTAATIVSGAVAERMRFHGYLLTCALIAVFIYPVVGHWAWASGVDGVNQGWLENIGFRDFAGSTVVHSVGGWAALAACIAIGPRLGRFRGNGRVREIQPSNLTLAYLGTFILFFGWFGFNCGSTLQVNRDIAPIAVNTLLGGCFGGISAVLISSLRLGVPEPKSICNGLLGGLVSITAAGNMIDPRSAAIIGAIAGVIVILSEWLLLKFKIDDAVGAIPVHGFCGAWGTIALAAFIHEESLPAHTSRWEFFSIQSLGVTATFAYVFGGIYGLLRLLQWCYPLRVKAKTEQIGLNVVEHNASSRLLDLAVSMDSAAKLKRLHPDCKIAPEFGTAVGDLIASFNQMVDQICNDQSALEAATQRAESLTVILDESPNEIVIIHAETGRIVSMNCGARANMQWDEDELPELMFEDLFETGFQTLQEFRHSEFNGDRAFTQRTVSALRKDGSNYPASISVQHADFLDQQVLVILTVDMTDQEQMKERLHAAEKMEAIGLLASGIAHEINTPLQSITGNVEFIQDFQSNIQHILTELSAPTCSDAQRKELASQIGTRRWSRWINESGEALEETQDSIGRIVSIVNAMRVLTHPGANTKASANLNEVIRNAAAISRPRWRDAAAIHWGLCESEPLIECHANELAQVFCNLFVNAGDAIREKMREQNSDCLGEIRVVTTVDSNGLKIAISDTGNGMPESVRRRCFEQFFTTKPVGQGTGQGLSIAYQIIVDRHGGTMEVTSDGSNGTQFDIWIPAEGMSSNRDAQSNNPSTQCVDQSC